MITVSAQVFSLVAQFRGDYAPFQGLYLAPHPDGGVIAVATRHGHIACFARDPQGSADEERTILPGDALLKAARPIKSAERFVVLEGATAMVTTRYATAGDKSVEAPITDSSKPLPDLRPVLASCIERWGATPDSTSTAGRYDTELLRHAIQAAEFSNGSLTLAAFDGGPLRLQSESMELVVLLMPQEARPIPEIPAWLTTFASA